jgi:hypothetical protein
MSYQLRLDINENITIDMTLSHTLTTLSVGVNIPKVITNGHNKIMTQKFTLLEVETTIVQVPLKQRTQSGWNFYL